VRSALADWISGDDLEWAAGKMFDMKLMMQVTH
jgi:hypothetical protein